MVAANNNPSRQKFSLGRIVATPAALKALAKSGDSAHDLFRRHATGDWGDVCAEDKRANEDALSIGERLFSAYHLRDGTLLLPSDY